MADVREAVNAMPDRIGKWSVGYYGTKRYQIEETIGPGLAKIVKIHDDIDAAYVEAMNHNTTLRG